jgi:hypothetical protein
MRFLLEEKWAVSRGLRVAGAEGFVGGDVGEVGDVLNGFVGGDLIRFIEGHNDLALGLGVVGSDELGRGLLRRRASLSVGR